MKTWIMIAALALGGCFGKKKDKETEEPPPANPPPPPPAAVVDATPADAAATPDNAAVDIPTETDFEQQAKEKITDKTAETELQAIEKSLSNE